MIRLVRVAFCCLAWCFLSGSTGVASAFAAENQTRVTLDVTVAPHDGEPVAGLSKDDFTVLDNGQPQQVSLFRSDKDNAGQTKVILVLDAINMDYSRVAFAKQQIIRYLQANGGHLAYPTTLAVVTDQSVKMQGIYTSDGNLLAQDLAKFDVGLRVLRESQGFYGATDRMGVSANALQRLLAQASTAQGRKLMIWVSPGWAMLTGPNVRIDLEQEKKIYAEITQLSYLSRGTRTILYAVDPLGTAEAGTFHAFYYKSFLKPVKKPADADFGNLSLQVLAISSGGLALNSNNDVAGLIAQITKSADPFYTLSFVPPAAEKPDEFHSIDIKVNKPGLNVNTRWGYYTRQ